MTFFESALPMAKKQGQTPGISNYVVKIHEKARTIFSSHEFPIRKYDTKNTFNILSPIFY